MVFDYFFLTEKDRETEANPMMVMKDEQSGEVYGRIVEHKGLREGDDGPISSMPSSSELWTGLYCTMAAPAAPWFWAN